MNREIKFRCWDQKDKKYLFPEKQGFVILPTMPSFGVTLPYENRSNPGNIDEDCIDWADADLLMGRYELEQYTGLKDKNGKEIYAGDRIKIKGSETIYTVEYGRGVWVARFGDESGDNICLFHYVQKDTVLYAEVIGNIHEPPKDFRPEHLKRMGVSISKGGGE